MAATTRTASGHDRQQRGEREHEERELLASLLEVERPEEREAVERREGGRSTGEAEGKLGDRPLEGPHKERERRGCEHDVERHEQEGVLRPQVHGQPDRRREQKRHRNDGRVADEGPGAGENDEDPGSHAGEVQRRREPVEVVPRHQRENSPASARSSARKPPVSAHFSAAEQDEHRTDSSDERGTLSEVPVSHRAPREPTPPLLRRAARKLGCMPKTEVDGLHLTEREREVLALLAQGLQLEEIGSASGSAPRPCARTSATPPTGWAPRTGRTRSRSRSATSSSDAVRAGGVALLAAAVVLASAGRGPPRRPEGRFGCAVFPASSVWNQRVDKLPVAKGSATLVRSIGLDSPVHADFGSGLYDGRRSAFRSSSSRARRRRSRGRASTTPTSPTRARTRSRRASRSRATRPRRRRPARADRRPRHLHALRALRAAPRGRGWAAGSGAIWSLRSNSSGPPAGRRPTRPGCRSFPGLARYDEVAAGAIDHALRFTAAHAPRVHLSRAALRERLDRPVAAADGPARAAEGELRHARLPAAGAGRARGAEALRDDPRRQRLAVVHQRRAGPGWSNDDLHSLGRVRGSDFEVVDTSGLRRR